MNLRSLYVALVLLVCSSFLQAQTDYGALIASSKGKSEIIKVKRSYGSTDRIEVKKGTWKYFNSGGILLKEEQFAPSENGAIPHGHWKYFNEEGAPILEEKYHLGRLIALRLHQSDSLINGDYTFSISCDSIICKENVYHKGVLKSIYTTGTGKWKNEINSFDPKKYLKPLTPHDDVMETYKSRLKYRSQWEGKELVNLLKNGDFNQSKVDVSYLAGIDEMVDDWLPASGTPDYYRMSPDSNGAIGIRVASGEGAYLEYITQRLSQPLQQGAVYGVRMRVRLSESSAVASDAMGIWLGNRVNDFGYFAQEQLPEAQVSNEKGSILADKQNWMYVEGNFVAKGDERFLVIGSFCEQRNMKLEEFSGGRAAEAYYLIDDVSLFLLAESDTDNPFARLKKGDTLTLKNVLFENDQDALLSVSEQTLGELLRFLRKYPERKILISGHTSSAGGYEHNMDLSARRAGRVKRFLTDGGIESDRLETAGFGPNRPVASNDTSQGQALNRRVEIEVLE